MVSYLCGMLIAEAFYNPQAIPLAMVLLFAVSMYPLGFMLGSSCSPCCSHGCDGLIKDIQCMRVTISNSHTSTIKNVCEECEDLNGTYTLTRIPKASWSGNDFVEYCVYGWEAVGCILKDNSIINPGLKMRLIFSTINSEVVATLAVSGFSMTHAWFTSTGPGSRPLILAYDMNIVSRDPLVLTGSSADVCLGYGDNTRSSVQVEQKLSWMYRDAPVQPLAVSQSPCQDMLNNWKCVADISVEPANTPCQKETWDYQDDPLATPFSRHNLTQCTLSIVRPQRFSTDADAIAGGFVVSESSFVFDIESVQDYFFGAWGASSDGCGMWRFKDYLGCGSYGLSDWQQGFCSIGPLGFSFLNTRANPAVMLEAHGHIKFNIDFNAIYNGIAPSFYFGYHCVSGNNCGDWVDWYYGGHGPAGSGPFHFPRFIYCGPENQTWWPNYQNFNNQNPLTWQGVFENPDYLIVQNQGGAWTRIGLAMEVTYS